MRQLRFYLPIHLKTSTQVQLDERCSRHALQVLRLKPGAMIILFNGEGGEYDAELIRVDKREVIAKIGEYHPLETESNLDLHLGLGISKGDRMDIAIQKAVELGVTCITPLTTQRSVVQLDSVRAQKRIQHWLGVIQSACEQCGRNRLPKLNTVIHINEWLSSEHAGLCLTLNPTATDTLMTVTSNTPVTSITLLIGPEGGLSETEIVDAQRQKFQGVRIGPRILRTETAVLSAITLVQARWGDLA